MGEDDVVGATEVGAAVTGTGAEVGADVGTVEGEAEGGAVAGDVGVVTVCNGLNPAASPWAATAMAASTTNKRRACHSVGIINGERVS